MSKAPKPIHIVFDTSILKSLNLDDLSAEFRLLQRLARRGKLKLWVPEMAAREWISQRSGPALRVLDQLQTAIKDLQRHPSLAEQPELVAIIRSDLCSIDKIKTLREASEQWHTERLTSLGLDVIELQPSDMRPVIEAYFGGMLPFSAKKAREDFPDALVLAGVMHVFQSHNDAIFACNDERLRRSAEAQGMTVAASVPEILKLKNIAALHTNTQFAVWWEGHFDIVKSRIKRREADILKDLENRLINEICTKTIEHPEIPEDNNEAWVASASILEISLDWEAAESFGEGLLSIPLQFEADVDLEFSVFRSDSFEVADWVKVFFGDFEEDHYFEACGSRRACYQARVVMEFSEALRNDEAEMDDAEFMIEDVKFDDFVDSRRGRNR